MFSPFAVDARTNTKYQRPEYKFIATQKKTRKFTKLNIFQHCLYHLPWLGWVGRKAPLVHSGHFADTLPLFVPIWLQTSLTQLITSKQFLSHPLMHFLVISSHMCSCCYWRKLDDNADIMRYICHCDLIVIEDRKS